MNFFKKIKSAISYRKTAVIGLLTSILMFLSTHFANAGWLDIATPSGVIAWLGSGLGYIVGLAAGALFWIVGLIVSLALNLNLHITEPGNLIVHSGWTIILNITNLGFVLAIIVIAFATVINYESYAIKKTIWKLIVAALLVNFSFVIAGTIVDIANTGTQFMMEKSGVNTPSAWSSAMGGMFQAQQFLEVDKNFDPTGSRLKGIAEGTLSSFLTIIVSLIFGAVFTFIAAITLFTVGILLFVRYVALSFLLMFSPIIWLARVFPFSAKYWSMWWQKFLRWTFFAPIMMFFMYLALSTMSGTMAAYGSVPSNFSSQAPITTPLAAVGQLFVVIGIMMGGMYVANLMGIEGANAVYNATSKYSKGWAYRGGQRVMSSKVMVGDKEKGTKGVTGWLANKGLVGRYAARGINYLGATTEKGAAGAISGYRNYVKGLSKDRLETEIVNATPGRSRNVAIEEAIKGKKLTPKILNSLLMNPDKLETILNGMKAQNISPSGVTAAIGFNSPKSLRAAQKIGGLMDVEFEKRSKEGFNPYDSLDYAAKTLRNPEIDELQDEISEEQKKNMEKSKVEDFSTMMSNELFKDSDKIFEDHPELKVTFGSAGIAAIQQGIADGMAKASKLSGMYKMFPNMQAKQIDKFTRAINLTAVKLPKFAADIEKATKNSKTKRFTGETEEESKTKEGENKEEKDKKGEDKK